MQLLAALSFALPSLVQGEPGTPAHVYENSLIQPRKLGNDLYQTLDEKYRKSIQKYEDEYFHGGIK